MPLHNLTVSKILDALHDTQSKVEQYVAEGRVVTEGDLLNLSKSLSQTFEVCVDVEKDCETTGAMCVAYKVLITNPESAGLVAISEFLADTRFCRSLTRGKIDEINIKQKSFQSTALSDKDIEKLEYWGQTLVDYTFLAWEPFFRSSRWAPSLDTAHDPDQLVPSRFQATICNFVDMQLNLWPCIKLRLDKYMIKGKNLYPEPFWNDSYLQCVMELDPRIISFVVAIPDLDINELARRGPMRRSDTSRKKNLLSNATRAQHVLVNTGIDCIRKMHNGRMLKQHARVAWRFNKTFSSIEDMLGNPYV